MENPKDWPPPPLDPLLDVVFDSELYILAKCRGLLSELNPRKRDRVLSWLLDWSAELSDKEAFDD
jgi:hypothetical protein